MSRVEPSPFLLVPGYTPVGGAGVYLGGVGLERVEAAQGVVDEHVMQTAAGLCVVCEV